ncbi:MAG: hypothetical protein K0S74_1606 [Chlamydiales bacterium]|jgi:uncharacterized protein YbbC (DUF1343 family)|nr:hypothetical protein [Chlamydiales bacterium]
MFCIRRIITTLLTLAIHCSIGSSLLAVNSKKMPSVKVGVDVFYAKGLHKELAGKKVGLITNQTAVNSLCQSTIQLVKQYAKDYRVVALFAPEHGLYGNAHASDSVADSCDESGLPIYSLHGATRRPTALMLKGIDVLLFDIMDVGVRSYTYVSTLCYVMEEAVKYGIKVIVFDRPNPINGLVVDGPVLDIGNRSFIGYLEIPMCHGMTMGELANYFNTEYKIGCKLEVIPMKGWKRTMSFSNTGLPWAPMSPHIPEPDTPQYYPMTNLLPEIVSSLNHGIGYTLPFKIIGAPWIDAKSLVMELNKKKLPGIHFFPFYYRPFYGQYRNKDCQGIRLSITDSCLYKPVYTQFVILEVVKKLYPQQFEKGIEKLKANNKTFMIAIGSDSAYRNIVSGSYLCSELMKGDEPKMKKFLQKRKKYLLTQYN